MKKIFSLVMAMIFGLYSTTWGAASQFPLSTIINVSVTSPTPGFAGFNTGNLAIFSDDAYTGTFPAAGIQYYQSPTQVGTDFGTSSKTYQEANSVFSQNPNILTASGQLIVVAMKTAAVTWSFSGIAASGAVSVNYAGNAVSINWNSSAATIQSLLRGVPGLSQVVVTGSIASQAVTIQMWGVYGETPSSFTFTNNTLQTGGSVAVTITSAVQTQGESLVDCLNRTQSQTAYAGVIPNERYSVIGTTDFNAAATAWQATNILLGIVGNTDALNQTSGDFYKNSQAGNTHTRCLSYFETNSNDDLLYLAGYFSLLLSVNYTGNNTTITMNLKNLAGVPVDDLIAPGTNLTNASAAGSDVYISIMGVPCVISYGANLFADQATNRLWLQGAVQTAWFNAAQQASTKIPQTEAGMNVFKNAVKQVLAQGVNNGYLAPGTWTLPNTFGNVTNFYNNIAQFGYYVYTTPIAQQSQANRANRIAPLMQVAVKEAGAVQTGSVIINVNP